MGCPLHSPARRQLARQTKQMERCHTAWRSRISPLVRETLSGSTKRAHQVSTIESCMCADNLTRAAG